MASPLIITALAAGLSGFSSADGLQRAEVYLVAGDCRAAAAKAVSQTGGELLSAYPSADGQSCVITVLVQGNGNERPRKVTVKLPM